MKKRLKKFRKSKVFNFVNLILIAFLFVELLLVGNWIATGNPIKSNLDKVLAVELALVE